MFWANNHMSSPQIEALLNKQDLTLYEVMDVEDILQECRSQNKKLVEYLTKPEVMEELVTLIVKEPSEDLDERSRYKYPNIACELLTCDIPSLNEKLAGSEALLSILYSFIETDQPLNPLLASFFSKTLGILVTRKSDQVSEFLKNRQQCVDLLLQHLDTSAIMDLILKLVTRVEGADMQQNILNWLDGQELVQRLIKTLASSADPVKHDNASQLLCDMITGTRDNRLTANKRPDPDVILNTLESPETVGLLLETILSGEKSESSIVGGIQVLFTLLIPDPDGVSNEGRARRSVEEGEIAISYSEQQEIIAEATIPYLEQLHSLLLDPPFKPPVRTTAGVLERPLGNTRINVARLFATLLTVDSTSIYEKIEELGVFQTLLDLFFEYSWNNFLHTQVERCLSLAISCKIPNTTEHIYNNLFVKSKLIERILEAWEKNEDRKDSELNGLRQGYMGHLINIANDIASRVESYNLLESFLKTNIPPEVLKKWESLVSAQLAEINEIQAMVLQQEPKESYYEENSDDYNSYNHSAYMQQMYSNFQGQQLASQFIENYGFHDDEFNDGDDTPQNYSDSIDQLITAAFTLSEEDLDKSEEMFNKMCQQKQKAGMEESGVGGNEWGDEGEMTFQTVVDKRDWPSKQQNHGSSSSDEDEDDQNYMNMDVDNTEPWDASETVATTNAILPKMDPWDTGSSQPVEQTGWANFDNFANFSSKISETTDNAPTVNIAQDTQTSAASAGDIVKTLDSKATAAENAAGDARVAQVPDNSPPAIAKTNLNTTTEAENVNAASAADSNANISSPVSVENRESSLEEIKETSKEIVENIIQSATSASTEKLTAAAKVEETPTSSPVVAHDQK